MQTLRILCKKFPNIIFIALLSNFVIAQNVGVGTLNPSFKLDVRNGSINTDSVYRIATFPVLSVTGTNTLFVGQHAGTNNDGDDNTFSGAFSGNLNTGGFSNSFYGTGSGYNNTGGFYNSFFGAYTGFYNTNGKDNSFFGMQAGASNTTGSANTFVGRSAGGLNNTGYSNSFFGMSAGFTNSTGFSNSFFGDSTGHSNTTGNANSFFGKAAGYSNTTGSSNTAHGEKALHFNTTGNFNTAVGTESLYSNGAGTLNTAIGGFTLHQNTSGSYNSAFGTNALTNNTEGYLNTAAGNSALLNNSTGTGNIAVGGEGLYQNSSGSFNTMVGTQGIYNNTTGNFNTGLGFNVEVATNNLSNATAIGANARVDCSNCMVLGSINNFNGGTSNVNVGIGNPSPTARLDVTGTFKLADGTQGAGRILTSDISGLASWQPPPPPPPVNYPVVWICCNPWMTKNLDASTYRNGDPIPHVTDNTEWTGLTTGAYCYHNNDSATYAATYGKLYNWYAVNDSRGLAPEGWHIPTDFEWTTLGTCLGGDALAGGPMKEIGTTHWNPPPNIGASNLSGFTGLPGGYRDDGGAFYGGVDFGIWWSSTEDENLNIWYRYLATNTTEITRGVFPKRSGFSVRCIKD